MLAIFFYRAQNLCQATFLVQRVSLEGFSSVWLFREFFNTFRYNLIIKYFGVNNDFLHFNRFMSTKKYQNPTHMMKTLPGIEKKVVHILHTNQFSPHFCYNFFSWTLKWKCLLPNHEVTNSLSSNKKTELVHLHHFFSVCKN